MFDAKLIELVNKMLQYDEFKLLFGDFQENTLDFLEDTFEHGSFLKACEELDITIAYGASRFVIIPKHEDYVYKVNFSDVNMDYCAMEKHIYDCARGTALEPMFAAIEQVDAIPFSFKFPVIEVLEEMGAEMDNISVSEAIQNCDANEWDEYSGELIFYRATKIPEKVDHSTITISDFIQNSKDDSPLTDHLVVAELFYRDYGEMLYQALSSFLVRHEVNDLHRNNVGLLNGKIVLLDYCGYNNDY